MIRNAELQAGDLVRVITKYGVRHSTVDTNDPALEQITVKIRDNYVSETVTVTYDYILNALCRIHRWQPTDNALIDRCEKCGEGRA